MRLLDSLYSIELFREGEGAGVEQVLDQYLNLTIARAVFKAKIKEYPGRLITVRSRSEGAGAERSTGNDTEVARRSAANLQPKFPQEHKANVALGQKVTRNARRAPGTDAGIT